MKYNAFSRDMMRACSGGLSSFMMEREQDPEEFFLKIEDLRERLHHIEENISDESFQDILLQGLTDYMTTSGTSIIATGRSG